MKEPGFVAPCRLGDDPQAQILADVERILKEFENLDKVAKFIAIPLISAPWLTTLPISPSSTTKAVN